MLFDTTALDRMYTESVNQGLPLLKFALFDSRVLFPRSVLPEIIERETGQRLTLAELDALEREGLFKWFGGAGDDGTELGVPMYVPTRIGLCSERLNKGWLMEELKDFAEWEEWIVSDTLSDGLSYEDDDCALIAREVASQLERLNEEIWSRLPVNEQPEGWKQMSSNSVFKARSLADLEAERERLDRYLAKLEFEDLTTATPERKQRLGRHAFRIRARDEFVRVVTVLSDRKKIEAGFSQAVSLLGKQSVFPEKGHLESYGEVDWHLTFTNWRFLEDPDHYPIRLPGFVLIGGKVTLEELHSPEVYKERSELFRLNEYVDLFKKVAAEPRCDNCSRILKAPVSGRRRYCSDQCSQAARQRTYRERQKATILRRPREG